MYKIIAFYKICFVLLFANLVFSSNIDAAYNFNIDDTQGVIDKLIIDFSYLNDDVISQSGFSKCDIQLLFSCKRASNFIQLVNSIPGSC